VEFQEVVVIVQEIALRRRQQNHTSHTLAEASQVACHHNVNQQDKHTKADFIEFAFFLPKN
jgi:hypothetical protein